jgi:hypothetical protein
MKKIIQYTLAVISIAIISGCASKPINVNLADPMTQQSASSFSVKPGSAKVYFVGGIQGSSISMKVAINPGAELIIDGNKMGPIDKGDVMVVDVVPSTYNFSWTDPLDAKMVPITKQLNAGDVVILQANFNTGGMGFGLIGMAVAPPEYQIKEVFDRGLVVGKRFVKPTTCPQKICN